MPDQFMAEALLLAKEAWNMDEIPIGALVIDNNSQKIISTAFNQMEHLKNATCHAEMLAINAACQILQSKYLINCSIYSTVEPCMMCACAISFTKIHSLYYAAPDIKQGAVESGIRFFTLRNCFHKPNIYTGIKEKEATQLMKDFFIKIRERKKLNNPAK